MISGWYKNAVTISDWCWDYKVSEKQDEQTFVAAVALKHVYRTVLEKR